MATEHSISDVEVLISKPVLLVSEKISQYQLVSANINLLPACCIARELQYILWISHVT